MDPITLAIVAALAAGALKGVGKLGENMVGDAYRGLIKLFQQKFGNESDVVKSVAVLEARPTSTVRSAAVSEALDDAKAVEDPELLAAAKAIMERVKDLPGGEKIVQQVTGSTNVAVAASGGTATVSVQPRSPEG
jgi:hypothetical protein